LRSEVLTALLRLRGQVDWYVQRYKILEENTASYTEDGGSMLLRNVGTCILYTAS